MRFRSFRHHSFLSAFFVHVKNSFGKYVRNFLGNFENAPVENSFCLTSVVYFRCIGVDAILPTMFDISAPWGEGLLAFFCAQSFVHFRMWAALEGGSTSANHNQSNTREPISVLIYVDILSDWHAHSIRND